MPWNFFWNKAIRFRPGLVLCLCLMGTVSSCRFTTADDSPVPTEGSARLIPSRNNEIALFATGVGGQGLAGGSRMRFDYDFYMDTVEVTRKEFSAMLGWSPPSPSQGSDVQALPVAMVTWYDAVLYCNAKSKALGLDTVYEYLSPIHTPGGSTTSLIGLKVDLSRKGYRLPTEAEWEFAAHGLPQTRWDWGDTPDTAQAEATAWFVKNSSSRPHAVATKAANRFGIHDLAGNVYEWVNDWLGPFPDGGALDYAGASSPNAEMEIPIKGGAYNYGFADLSPSKRISTYPALPTSATPYIGFRCALGAIPNPVFGGASGILSANPVQCLAPDLARKLAHPAKIVFVNVVSDTKRFLAYVDFSESDPQVRQFEDSEAVFYPAISPDGRWVAYCNRIVGFGGKSSLFLRSLDPKHPALVKLPAESGFGPHWWINPATGDTCVVYSNSGMVNEFAAAWEATQTYVQTIRSGAAAEPATILVDRGGYHDGISTDGRYLATGYTRLRLLDRREKSGRILFTGPLNGKPPGDTSQVCNVSMAPDSSGNTLFLDFGSNAVSKLTGTAYGTHEYAFISSPSGQILRWIRSPEDEPWEDLKWSNHPDFAVSGTTRGNSRPFVYLLDLKDSSYQPVLKGSDIEQANLWVGDAPAAVSLSDSLGLYNEPSGSVIREHLAIKFSPFWNAHDSIEAAFVGHSRVEMGVNTGLIKSAKAFNFGFSGADLYGSSRVIRDYLFNHCPNLKVIVLDPQMEFLYEPPGNGDWSWTDQVAGNKGYQYDRNHDFWKSGLPPNFPATLASVPQPQFSSVDPNGWLNWWPGPDLGWNAKPAVVKGLDWDASDTTYPKNLLYLKNLVTEASQRGIAVIAVLFPQNPAFLSEGSYGLYGPKLTTAQKVVKDLSGWETEIPGFKLYDAYNFGKNDYSGADAYDDSHLNAQGAEKMTRRLDSLIASVLKR
jgi:uncharacterized protein (TIGR02171 family)